MPGGDRMGPQGGGPKTGRGLGYCADNDQPGYAAPQSGRRTGFGFRRGRRGRGRGSGEGQGQGPGRMGGPLAAGPDGFCVCPSCGHKIKHIAGKPCNQQKCPECGAQMVRE